MSFPAINLHVQRISHINLNLGRGDFPYSFLAVWHRNRHANLCALDPGHAETGIPLHDQDDVCRPAALMARVRDCGAPFDLRKLAKWRLSIIDNWFTPRKMMFADQKNVNEQSPQL